MNTERLKRARERLSLTQDYVARYLGIPRSAMVQLENGNRRISGDELTKLCTLYGISADYALGMKDEMDTRELFTRKFEGLPENDKEDILSLIEFKRQLNLKKKRAGE